MTGIKELSDLDFNSYNFLRNKSQDEQEEKLLELYSFGTIHDYFQNRDKFGELSHIELNKLKVLSLISILEDKIVLGFDEISDGLYIDKVNDSDIIKVLLSILQSKLIDFKIDELKREIYIVDVIPRDIFIKTIDRPLKFLREEDANKFEDVLKYIERFKDERLASVIKELEGGNNQHQEGNGNTNQNNEADNRQTHSSGTKRPLEH